MTSQLLGEENFSALAAAFWQSHPPQRGDMGWWGEALPGFVAAAAQLKDEPYLADVGRVEWALHRALFAADVAPDHASLSVLLETDPCDVHLTLASGVLVLYAALLGSQDERTREAGLLRALGATRKQLSQAQRIEFVLVGGLAGVLAASGAAAVGWTLAKFVFQFEWVFDPMVWLVGLVAGAACAMIGGWIGLRNVLNQPPLQSLREA